MREKGEVIETTQSSAKVLLQSCETCKTCSASYLCRPSGDDRVIEAKNSIGAHSGDEVYVEISAKTGFLALFLLFGLPVILGLIGLLLGVQYSDTHSLVFGVIGLTVGLIIAKVVNNMISKNQKFLPRVTEIIKTKGA